MVDKNELRRELDLLNHKGKPTQADRDRARDIRWALREMGEQVVAQPYCGFLREDEKLPYALSMIRKAFGKN